MPTPEFVRFEQAFEQGMSRALVETARVYQAAIREKLQRGYTSGTFVQGVEAAAVHLQPPERTPAGEWEVRVGTDSAVSMYWELGHQNLFTGKYERVEYWRETAQEQAGLMASAFGTELKRTEIR